MSEWPDTSERDDPRSELTGKKIRRIDTGLPGTSSSPALRRRERPGGTQALAGSDRAPTPDDTQLGDPPSARPGRHIGRPPTLAGRPPADPDRDLGGLGGLPPLRQPTGEQPVVPPTAASPVDPVDWTPPSALDADPAPAGPPPRPDETRPVGPADVLDFPAPNGSSNGRSTDLPDLGPAPSGVFDEPTEATSLASLAELVEPKAPAEPSPPADPTDRPVRHDLDDASETVRAELAAMPSVFDVEPDDGPPAVASSDDPTALDPSDRIPSSLSSAFPEAGDPPSPAAEPGESSPNAAFPSWSGSMADHQRTDDSTRTMGAMPRDRVPRSAMGRPDAPRRPGSVDRGGLDGGLGPSGRPPTRGASQRLQETEIKLAGRQEPRSKPQEPNRLVLGLALALVVLAGAAVAWWLTRDDDATAGEEAITEDTQTETTDTTLTTTDTAPAAPAADEPILDVPELSLIGVEPGPLDPAVTYSIDLAGEAPGSMLQVVVDGVPQGQPDLLLPDLILPPGRHTLSVSVTNGAEVKTSTPVEVYVLGAPPEAGIIANLASIDMINEGWAEAIRRFDGFVDAGHQNLQLLPITPGYWNIFVPEIGDTAAINAYCESFGLAMPDDCFAKSFDPATYTGPTVTTPTTTPASTTPDDTMTDQTGGETSSTTTGG